MFVYVIKKLKITTYRYTPTVTENLLLLGGTYI